MLSLFNYSLAEAHALVPAHAQLIRVGLAVPGLDPVTIRADIEHLIQLIRAAGGPPVPRAIQRLDHFIVRVGRYEVEKVSQVRDLCRRVVDVSLDQRAEFLLGEVGLEGGRSTKLRQVHEDEVDVEAGLA